MRHGKRIFSVIALSVAVSLVVVSTVYHAKADDTPSNSSGTGYAGVEVAAVTGLNATSTGTFNYNAGEEGENISITASDIEGLMRATKALSAQIVALGDAAKDADDETKEAVNNKMVAVTASLNSASITLSTLQDRMSAFEGNYAPATARCYTKFNLNAPSGLTVAPETPWLNSQADANYNASTGIVKAGTVFKQNNIVPAVTLSNGGKVSTTVSKSLPEGNSNPENIDLTKYHYTGQATQTTTYTLSGWYDAASGGTKVYEPSATYTQFTDENTYYAQYSSEVSYNYLYASNYVDSINGKLDPNGIIYRTPTQLYKQFPYNNGWSYDYVIFEGKYTKADLTSENSYNLLYGYYDYQLRRPGTNGRLGVYEGSTHRESAHTITVNWFSGLSSGYTDSRYEISDTSNTVYTLVPRVN